VLPSSVAKRCFREIMMWFGSETVISHNCSFRIVKIRIISDLRMLEWVVVDYFLIVA
jgi:hypothetical protein